MLRNNADARRCSYFDLGLPVTEQNRISRDWVRLVRLSSVIELIGKFQFDYVRLPNQWNNNPTDWVRLSSIDFWFGFDLLATPGNEVTVLPRWPCFFSPLVQVLMDQELSPFREIRPRLIKFWPPDRKTHWYCWEISRSGDCMFFSP